MSKALRATMTEGSQRRVDEGTAPELSAGQDSPEGTEALGSPGMSALAWWVLGISVTAVMAAALQIVREEPGQGRFLITLAFVVCSAGAFLDAATRRIPNALTYPAILLGLGLNALLPLIAAAAEWDTLSVWLGATGFRDGVFGFGLCAAIGIVSFIARGLGGGDVKLLGALGAILGFEAIVAVLFNTLIVAALIGIINWTANGTILARLQILANNLLSRALMKGKGTVETPFASTEAPFGVALLIGLMLAQFVALHRAVLQVGW